MKFFPRISLAQGFSASSTGKNGLAMAFWRRPSPAHVKGLLETLKQEVWLPDFKDMYIKTAHSRV